ncbi:MAG: betaine/proline/choline family ABC transporter ATP-binding protein [Halanaerobiales bacterium]|nr:betaine/proline/choline family ABC transporter ATP-binding protein [Halanaerobiales bacterium]
MEDLTKVYSGEEEEAVSNLNLHVEEGEICVFVGPSGCGKTTTLKMLNRLIEPTSGKIYIEGTNVVEQDKNILRRKIGYVIQQIGLFPHMTIRENIATVPKLLDWDEERIEERVVKLLDLIGLDSENHIDKYPNELSGGQQQRVGVARAMAADPPIMLMDEPFGAVDPITRAELQNEFIRLQKKINKTICFVTHDIDEAIKMGDKIAIMNNGKLVQYDSPKNILFNPKNEFVEDFIGSDRGLKVLNLLKAEKIMDEVDYTADSSDGYKQVMEKLELSEQKYILITRDKKRLAGYVNLKRLEDNQSIDWKQHIKETPVIEEDASLKDVLNKMIENDVELIPIVDEDENLIGQMTMDDIQRYISDEYNQ